MRLINVHTYKLHEFYDAEVPPYAILSHTWEDDEITYEELINGGIGHYNDGHPGARKIRFLCLQAREDKLEWAWLDTCCINKDSSAELSEAINSMFRWYHRAEVCYAFLSDIPSSYYWNADRGFSTDMSKALASSRWFRRGWCLQELIAPQRAKFYGQRWNPLGNRDVLSSIISRITGIREKILQDGQNEVRRCSVAEKMSWAASRETSRVEDTAYCLLGIFEVNMPMLYGEGSRAFQRLQEEIIKATDDHSIFVWQPRDATELHLLLAPEPSRFTHGALVVTIPSLHHVDGHTLGNTGLRISLRCRRHVSGLWTFRRADEQEGCYHAVLGCRYRDDFSHVISLCLQGRQDSERSDDAPELTKALFVAPTIARSQRYIVEKAPHTINDFPSWSPLIISRALPVAEKQEVSAGAKYWFDTAESSGFNIVAAYPPEHFNSQTFVMDLTSSQIQYGAVLISLSESLARATGFDESSWHSRSLAVVFGGWTAPGRKYDAEKDTIGIFGVVQSNLKNLSNACRLAVSRSIFRSPDASQHHVAWVRSTYSVPWSRDYRLHVKFKGDRRIGILGEVVNKISLNLHHIHEATKITLMPLLQQAEEADGNPLSVERLQDVVRSYTERDFNDPQSSTEGPQPDVVYELEDDSWRVHPPEDSGDSEYEELIP